MDEAGVAAAGVDEAGEAAVGAVVGTEAGAGKNKIFVAVGRSK